MTGLLTRKQQRLLVLDAHTRASMAFEAQLAGPLAAELARTGRAYAALLEERGRAVTQDALAPVTAAHAQRLARILLGYGKAIAAHFAGRFTQALAKHAGPAEAKRTDEAAQARIDEKVRALVQQRAAGISEATQRAIWAAIADGLATDRSVSEIASDIVARTGGAVGRIRAELIARNAVHTISNLATFEQARATDLLLDKEWLSARDNRVRPTHREADGQSVALNGHFIVGSALLEFPGDPGGPPEEVINCRCTLLYHPAGGAG